MKKDEPLVSAAELEALIHGWGSDSKEKNVDPKNGSYPAVVIRSDVIHGGSGRVIFATT